MSIIGNRRDVFRSWLSLGFVVSSCLVFQSTCVAQPGSWYPAPTQWQSFGGAPSGSSFGQPPMAIGPAPYVTPYPAYGAPAYGSFYGSNSYPHPVYPANPYWVQRPGTPFDVAVSPYPSQSPYSSPTTRFSPQPVESGTVWTHPVERQILPSAASIGNFRVTVGENFLNRLIARNEHKPGGVDDVILGAKVTGVQTTETNLRFDLVPSPDKIQGVFVLNGTTDSQTTGITPQAMIDTASRQRFVATKDVYFDGMSFSTRHATVRVQARNQTVGATTPLSGGLFGRIADGIAYRTAERRQAEAEAETSDHVAARVYPEFDSEIDRNLANANRQLDSVLRQALRARNLMPTQQHVSSTDISFNYCAQIGADSPTQSTRSLENLSAGSEGVRVLVHESLVTALIGSTGLKGLKTTEKEIKKFFAPYEVPSTADELENSRPSIAVPGMDNIVTEVEFDEVEPLRIRIEDDRVFVTLNAIFKPAGQELLPALAVTIEYKATLSGDKILVTPGKVHVALQKEDDSNATTGIAFKLIAQGIEASLVKLAFDRSLPASLWSYGGIVPRVTGIRSQDGWAAISID